MRDLAFERGTEIASVRIINKKLFFSTLQGGVFALSPLEGIKLDIRGILIEHPDLKGKPEKEMRKIALERLEDKINSMKTEQEIQDYVKEELEKFGWKLTIIRRKGFRPKKVK